MKPQKAPARKPAIMVAGMRSQPGPRVEKSAGNQVAMSAPGMICPSPPMLMTLARKAMQIPSPTRSSGVALTRVCVRPKRLPTAPLTSAAYAASGFALRMTSMTAPRMSAKTTPTTGSRTLSATRLTSMVGAPRRRVGGVAFSGIKIDSSDFLSTISGCLS